MYIFYDIDDEENFKKLIEDSDQAVSDFINNGTQEDFDTDDYRNFYEKYPPCLDDLDNCKIIQDHIPMDCIEPLGNATEVILHAIDGAKDEFDVITCFDDDLLVSKAECSFSPENTRLIFNKLLSKYFISDHYNEDGSLPEKGFGLYGSKFLEEDYSPANQFLFYFGDTYESSFFDKKVNVTHKNFGLDVDYIGEADFEYFSNYYIRMENQFNYLPEIYNIPIPSLSSSKGKQPQLIKVPGLYLPYAAEKWTDQQLDEDIELTIQVATALFTIYGLPVAAANVMTARSLAWAASIAAADLTNELGGVILTHGLCECAFNIDGLTPEEIEAFCKKWKVFSKVTDLVLMGDLGIDALKNLTDLRKAVDDLQLSPNEANTVKKQLDETIISNGGTKEQSTDLWKLVNGELSLIEILSLFEELYAPLKSSNKGQKLFNSPDGDIYNLALSLFNGNLQVTKFLEPDIVNHLLSLNSTKGIDDVAEFFAATNASKLVDDFGVFHKLDELTPDIIDTWVFPVVKSRPQLRLNMDVLNNLTEVRLNEALSEPLTSIFEGNGWDNLFAKLTNPTIPKGYKFGCSTCTGGDQPWVEHILKNLNGFSKFSSNTGFLKTIKEFNVNANRLRGANWSMEFSNTHNFKNPAKVKFEVKVNEDGGDFVVDIIDGKDFYECKSWHKNWAENSSGFFDQWFNYVNSLESIENLHYRFHPSTKQYERHKFLKEEFESELKKYKTQFDITDDGLSEYGVFFGFDGDEIMNINDVDDLIKLISSRFDKMFK